MGSKLDATNSKGIVLKINRNWMKKIGAGPETNMLFKKSTIFTQSWFPIEIETQIRPTFV